MNIDPRRPTSLFGIMKLLHAEATPISATNSDPRQDATNNARFKRFWKD
jgi:hypothetical protein